MTETIEYRDLVFDLDLYPRMDVDAERVGMLKDVLDGGNSVANGDLAKLIDSERVAHLRAVIEAGGALPPIVVDRSTHKVVDGFHRSRAYFSLRGAHAEIPCVFHAYADRGAMLLDAIRLNASHGKPLTRRDQTRCLALAERLNVTVEQVAAVMNVRPERVADMASVRAKLAAPKSVQPLRMRAGHARLVAGSNPRVDPRPHVVASVGVGELNAVVRAIRNGDLDMRDRQVRGTVRYLVKVAIERLREVEAA